jgi:FkbM family methyltransferase
LSDNYKWSLEFLPANIHSIVEVGSRDALDAIFLSRQFSANVIAFEPNPSSIQVCIENLKNSSDSSVELRTEALSNIDGEVDFLAVDESLYNNPGASGLFKIDFSNRRKKDLNYNLSPIQSPIKVLAARWDSLNLQNPDLLVMDCEGAELLVLQGFGEELKHVRFIVLETSPVAIGQGACTFREIDIFLTQRGFKLKATSIFGARIRYLKIRLFLSTIKNRCIKPFGAPLRGRMFDALYVNSEY